MLEFSPVLDWLLEHEYGFAATPFSLVFGALVFFTLVVVGKFSRNYLSGEVGKNKFWVLYFFFALGMFISCFSMNLKTFYVGWEIVGLASFFLIAFYQTNTRSVENSLIALSNYKICDLFFVLAILLEETPFHKTAGLFLILATLGKSAQIPFSSWLYRALEGPTPSSTLFYGGLSLHLGAFVLLQFSHMWDGDFNLRLLIGVVGLSSAIYGFLVGSTRSDLKTSFAFASISQVGLIYFEMSLGFYQLAMWHIIGHNLLRTWNYLRGMSFFDEFFKEEYHRQNSPIWNKLFNFLPASLFFHSLNGFYFDQIFLWLRKWGLIAATVIGLSDLAYHQQDPFAYSLLGLATLVTVFLFLKDDLKPTFFTAGLVLSQVLILASIHTFFEDQLEHLYLLVSLFSLIVMIFSIWPGLKLLFLNHKAHFSKQRFLGLSNQFPFHHTLFIISALLITGAPASFEFFVQEGIVDEIWVKSHIFVVILMLCVTLNTVHTFKIGQAVFLGEENVC